MTTTYSVKGKKIGLKFLFKYCLNGHLKGFEIIEGELNGAQMKWLFSPNFPANESIIRSVWMKEKGYTDKFEVSIAPADFSFESFWEFYDHKVKKVDAEKQWNKLNQPDKIKCFICLPGYNAYLQRRRISKAHLSTFINQKYFEDDWNKA
jgi:hypothetical protein